MSIFISSLSQEYVAKVISFFNYEQSDKKQQHNRLLEEFDWLFFRGPYKSALYKVASDSETENVLGTFAGIFYPMISPTGDLIMTLKGEDTLISLDRMIKFGKRDILKELVTKLEKEAKTDNVRFIWGFSPAKTAFRRCGFKIVCPVKGSFYVINPLKFYKQRINQYPQISFIKKIFLIGFSFFNCIKQNLLSLQFKHFKYRQISFNEINFKVLVSLLPKDVYATYLSKEFLKWRISDNPSQMVYEFLEFQDKFGEINAYFIFSYNKQNVYFVEQFFLQKGLSEPSKLVIMKQAFSFCKKQKGIVIRASGFTHNKKNVDEIRLLKKAGFYFFNNSEGSNFIFKNLPGTYIIPDDIYLSRLNTIGLV